MILGNPFQEIPQRSHIDLLDNNKRDLFAKKIYPCAVPPKEEIVFLFVSLKAPVYTQVYGEMHQSA